MNKRGISNVEMIIAATIFIFSIVLVIYYINLVGLRPQTQNVFLDTLEQGIRERAEISYNIIYLSISYNANCFNISPHSSMDDNENFSFIKAQNAVNFRISDKRLFIENPHSQGHYTIYSFPFNVTYSHTFDPRDCINLTKGQEYNYSIPYQDKIFVYDKIHELNQSYYFHYYTLKNEMGLNNTDFAITVFNSTDTLFNMTRFKPQVQISAKEFPIKIIKDSGEISEAVVNIQVW